MSGLGDWGGGGDGSRVKDRNGGGGGGRTPLISIHPKGQGVRDQALYNILSIRSDHLVCGTVITSMSVRFAKNVQGRSQVVWGLMSGVSSIHTAVR